MNFDFFQYRFVLNYSLVISEKLSGNLYNKKIHEERKDNRRKWLNFPLKINIQAIEKKNLQLNYRRKGKTIFIHL